MSNLDNVVVHTSTKEKYDSLMKLLDKRGYTWASGHNVFDHCVYNNNRDMTCICLSYNKKISYADKAYYIQRSGYNVISYEEYIARNDDIKSKIKELMDHIHPHKLVIKIANETEYNKLMEIILPRGWSWNHPKFYSYDDIPFYSNGLCINISVKNLMYCSTDYYERHSNEYKIMSFEDFKVKLNNKPQSTPNLNKILIEILNGYKLS